MTWKVINQMELTIQLINDWNNGAPPLKIRGAGGVMKGEIV